jgi:DNA-directed RNA polymerase subunit L
VVQEHLLPLAASEEDFTLVVSLNEYILRGDAVGTSCTYVDLRV